MPARAWWFKSTYPHHRRLTAIAPNFQGGQQVTYGNTREQVTLRGGLFSFARASARVLGFGRVDSRFEGLARFQGAPAAFSGQQFGERRGQFVADDFVVDDADAGEECLGLDSLH